MAKRIATACSLLLVAASVANAVVIWTGGAGDHKWSSGGNWDSGIAPVSTTDEARINTADYVNVDCDVAVGMIRMCYSSTSDVATLNLTAAAGFTGHTLTVYKATTEVFSVGYLGAATVNQDTGTVHVYNGSSTGEIRVTRSATNPTSVYNLSGGIMIFDVLRKGFTGTASPPGLNDTGGTLIPVTLYRMGTYDGSVHTWTQGASLLAVGGLDTVGVYSDGNASYEQKHVTSGGGTSVIELDLVSDSSYDVGHGSGNADFTKGELRIKAQGTYVPAVSSFFDVWKLDLKAGKAGTGTFDAITDNLPGYFTAEWKDLDSDTKTETLRLTYLPEPATLTLLLMGGSAVLMRRRRTKRFDGNAIAIVTVTADTPGHTRCVLFLPSGQAACRSPRDAPW